MTLLLGLSVLVLPAAPPASADPFGECTLYPRDTGCFADSRQHTFCFGPSTEGFPLVRDAIRRAATVMRNQTVMGVAGQGDNCDTGTDVAWREGQAGGNRGVWDCFDGFQQGNICRRGFAVLNTEVIGRDGGPYELNLNKTACHELGHSVGMTHHDPDYNDCMVSGRVFDGKDDYNGHHIGHVRQRYGD